MDAKSRANFINSVAAGEVISCPICGASNPSDNKFCMTCGNKLAIAQSSSGSVPAFEQIKKTETNEKVVKYVEPSSVFAQGLPEWNVEPPQVMVRRH